MPKRHIDDVDIDYYLLLLDKDGAVRREADGSLLSEALGGLVRDGVTDVFVISHGWMGDIPAAIQQYDRWIRVMARQAADRARVRQLVPDFKALTIGIHWPSLPWGDDRLESAVLGEDLDELAAEREMSASELVDRYAQRLADTPRARQALAMIVDYADSAAPRSAGAEGIPPELEAAYRDLFAEAGLGTGGAGAPPGMDQADFAPAKTSEQWMKALSHDSVTRPQGGPGLLGGGVLSNLRDRLLSPVRQMSFWAMKHRARVVGERAVHQLLVNLQTQAPQARFHLMGHSFGCIVMTAAVAGPIADGRLTNPLPRPVDSLFLVQGAMSLWSFADMIPFPPSEAGYFKPLRAAPHMVGGPIVTTRSSHDSAVGTFFPIGATLGQERTLGEDDLPEYGGIGTFGVRGTQPAFDRPIDNASATYHFDPGSVYNIEASSVISRGGFPSGAHSDIAHPEVAHVFWEAALSGIGRTD